MTSTPDPRLARLQELLGIEATQGLSSAEADELDTLLGLFPEEDPDGFELAAAAVHLALSAPLEPMPSHLVEKLHLTAAALVPTRPVSPKSAGTRPAWLTWVGWAVAASLLAVLVYTYWPKHERTVAEKREQLLKDATAKPESFEGAEKAVTGNVVWSDAKQEGYLEVKGLAPNDPAKEQYQLWIVDGSRTDPDHKQPVSGGVFNVNADGTATISVHAAVVVKDAKVFAVTKETAGGVIVSKGPMLLVMTPKQG